MSQPTPLTEREAAARLRAETQALVDNDDRQDFEFGNRGFIATRTDPVIPRDGGGVAYNLASYDLLDGPCPETVNPSLWRQARLLTKHGLFEVCPGIYQVRGFDVSTVSFIDAGDGWIAPTDDVTTTGQAIIVGTVTMVFQVTPETEAPAEMNFYLPGFRALFMAENANATMHNLLPARGALVRDSKAWADYLTEAVRLFGDRSDLMFAAHGVPRFGQREVVAYLKSHRDAYKFLHDQTVRMMNNGMLPAEIAEELRLPDVVGRQWYNRGYYGTLSHNAKAVYQRYIGWYDGNPAHLWTLPPEQESARYVEAMGGIDAVLARALDAADAGDLRWAATLLNHAVFSDGANMAAREALARVYTALGQTAEAGTWRNIYLTGAQELGPTPPFGRAAAVIRPDVLIAATTSMILDVAAVRMNPANAPAAPITLNIELTDRDERHFVSVENGVLVHEEGVSEPSARATVRLARPALLMTLFGLASATDLIASGQITVEGEAGVYEALTALIEQPLANFNIVLP